MVETKQAKVRRLNSTHLVLVKARAKEYEEARRKAKSGKEEDLSQSKASLGYKIEKKGNKHRETSIAGCNSV